MSRHYGWPETAAGAGRVAGATCPGPHHRSWWRDDPCRFGWSVCWNLQPNPTDLPRCRSGRKGGMLARGGAANTPLIHGTHRGVTSVIVENVPATGAVRIDALVDTGAGYLTLPMAWKERFGAFALEEEVALQTATQQVVSGTVCGPALVRIEGFRPIHGEVLFGRDGTGRGRVRATAWLHTARAVRCGRGSDRSPPAAGAIHRRQDSSLNGPGVRAFNPAGPVRADRDYQIARQRHSGHGVGHVAPSPRPTGRGGNGCATRGG